MDGTNQYVSTNTLGFTSFETLIGGSGADTFTVSGTQTAKLSGGAGADTFQVGEGAALTGTLDGGADADTLTYAAATTARQVTLTGLGSVDGFVGTASSISGGFSNIDAVVGSTGADTLTGLNAAATWEVDGSNRYTSTNTLSLTAFETLVGGSGLDTFTISGAPSADVRGGAGADQFTFADGATLTGTLQGGADTDTLDYAAVTAAVTVNLATGTATQVTGGVSGMENVTGGSGNDTLSGDAQANVLIGGSGHDTVSGDAGDDTLIVTAQAGAVVDGGAGVDTVIVRGTEAADDLQAFDTRVTLGTSPNRCSDLHECGTPDHRSARRGRYDYGQRDQRWPGDHAGRRLGEDSLSAGDGDITWTLTGETSGMAAAGAMVEFTSIEHLLGGQGEDTLIIVPILVPPGPNPPPPPPPPEIKIMEDPTDPTKPQVDIKNPDPTKPEPKTIQVTGVDTIVSTQVVTSVVIGVIAPIAIGVLQGSTIVGPVIAGGVSWVIGGIGGLFGGLFGGFSAVLTGIFQPPGTTTPPQTKIETRDPDQPPPDPQPTKIEVKNPDDKIKNDPDPDDPDDPDDDDDDDEEACKAEYTIDAGGASFEAADCINVWNITGPNSGTLVSDGVFDKTFSNVGNLIGGSLSDTFIVGPSGRLTGSIDGGGLSLANSLTFTSGDHDWSIDGTDAGSVTGIDGGFENIATLTGGAGADHLTLAGGRLTGLLTGGLGNNSLQGSDGSNNWTLTGLDAGTVNGLTLGFVTIGSLIGGSGLDQFSLMAGSLSGSIDGGGSPTGNTLTGPSAGATWTINTANGGSVSGVAGGFSNVANLVGGVGDDVFDLSGAGSLSGSIDGGSGSNTLIAGNADDAVVITGLDTGTESSVAGGFSNIGNINTGGGNDSLILESGARLSGSIDGGDGADDVLEGGNTTWNILGPNQGTHSNINGRWRNFERLRGKDADDLFIFHVGGSLSRSIDGGGGTNTIQGPDADTTWTLDRQNGGTLSSGGGPLAGTGFRNIQNLTGGAADDTFNLGAGSLTGSITGGGATTQNVLAGPNADTNWSITGADQGNITANAAAAIVAGGFAQIGSLRGGTGNDTFTLNDPGSLSGSIDGGGLAMNNTLQGPNAAKTWTITDVDQGSVTGITGGFTLIGQLRGGTAADTFVLQGQGRLTGSLDGGAQANAAARNTLQGPDAALNWTINGADAGQVTDTAGNVTYIAAYSNIANLTGGSEADTFTLDVNGRLSGTLNGGAQADNTKQNTLRGPNSALKWTVNSLDAGQVTDVAGNVTFITAFNQIARLAGGNQDDQFVIAIGARLRGSLAGGDGANSLEVQRLSTLSETNWTVTAVNAGTVESRAGIGGTMTSRIGAGFTQIGQLVGSDVVDRFILQGAGLLTGSITGGMGAKTLQGANQATTWTVSGADAGDLTVGMAVNFDGTNPAIINPITGALTLGAGHNLQTGQAIRYSHGAGGMDVGGLMDGQVYFVRAVANDPNAVQLAATRADALGGNNLIVLHVAGAGNAHTLTPLIDWRQVGALTGGTANDSFVLQNNGRLTGAITGGTGNNSLRGPDVDAVWTVNNADAGTVTAVGGNPVFITNGFTQIGSLIGGAAKDQFMLQAAGSLTGLLDGGGGDNLLRAEGQPAASRTVWTLTGLDSGTLQSSTDVPNGQPVVNPLITGGFDNISSLAGGAINDAFVFEPGGNLFGSVHGGGGTNTLQFKLNPNAAVQANDARIWVVTGANTGWASNQGDLFLITGANLDPNGTFNDAAVDGAADTITLANKGFHTGQAVVYRAGNANQVIGGLTSDQPYYVIADPNTPDVYQLATSLENAYAGQAIDLTAPTPGSQHSLTDVLGFGNVANLTADREQDTFALMAGGSLSGTIDGGAEGRNTLRGPNISANWWLTDVDRGRAVKAADNAVLVNSFIQIADLVGGTADDSFTLQGDGRVSGAIDGGAGDNTLRGPDVGATWTVNGIDRGSMLINDPSIFDGTQVGSNPFNDTIDFAVAHGLVTGQAVRYNHGPNGADVGGLQDGTVYFVRAVSDTSLRLAPTRQDALDSTHLINTAAAVSGTQHTLTPLMDWAQIGSLKGGAADDAFVLQANGRLSGSITGGAGENSLRGLDLATRWVVSGDDTGDMTAGAAVTFDGTNPAIINPIGDELTLGNGHNLLTGQSVRYSHGPGGTDVGGLTDGQVYYVRVVANNPNAVQLATNRADALSGNNLIPLNIAGAGNAHTLTPVTQFTQVGHLTGGTANDDFTLQGNGRLTGSINGDGGTNTLRGPDRDTTWTVNGIDSGSMSIAADVVFDGTRLTTNPFANDEIEFTGPHGFTTGQAVRYSHGVAGVDGGGLADGQTYYVRVLSQAKVSLAPTRADALSGNNLINLVAATAGTAHSLTPVAVFAAISELTGGANNDAFALRGNGRLTGSITGGAGDNSLQGLDQATRWTVLGDDAGEMTIGAAVTFDGADGAVVNNNALTLAGHNLLTGQAVRYSHGAGGTDVGGLTDGQVYYVRVVANNPNALQLATNRADALSGNNLIPLNIAGSGNAHTLTPVTQFTQVGRLTGGTANDDFTLQGNVRLTGSITGGGGINTVRGPDRDTTWTVNGIDSGSMANGAPLVFNGTQVNPANNPFETAINLNAAHGLRTGQAVQYVHGPAGSDVGGLQDGAIYYVHVVNATTLELATTLAEALSGNNLITVGAATSGTQHAFTPQMNWAQVAELTGEAHNDAFVLRGDGRQTGSIAGGTGVNSIQGPDRNVTWSVFEPGLNQLDRVAFDANELAVTAVNNNVLTVGNHPWVTGQAVVYHASDPDHPIPNLVDNTTYFVIVDPNNANMVQLAMTRANALGNNPIPALGAIQAGTTHSLTTAMVFTGIQRLTGGAAKDAFDLVKQTVSPFGTSILSIDGGLGGNALAVKIDANTVVQPTDAMVWTVTGSDSGWVSDGTSNFLTTEAASFVQTAVGTDQTSFTLPAHRWQTGQAVVYRKQGGADITGLDNATVYYVIRVDADTMKLASTLPNATAANPVAINTFVAQGAGTHVLTAVDQRNTAMFTGANVDTNGTNEINLANHGLLTGQAVVYRSGSGDTTKIAQLTDNRVYFVIKIDDNTLKLADTLDDALVNNPVAIAITNPANASKHSLTRVVAFANTGTLTGDREADTFALRSTAPLTGVLNGGAGFNSLRGPAVDAIWTAFDRAFNTRLDRVAFDATTSPIVGVTAAERLRVTAHPFRTGQAVVYRASDPTQSISNLVDNTTYYVITIPNDANFIRLAATQDQAFAGVAITGLAVNTAVNHTLTAAVTFSGIQSLAGGGADDTFSLVMNAARVFNDAVKEVDGGRGLNRLQTRLELPNGVNVAPTDELIFAATGVDSGWLADRAAKFLFTLPVDFDRSAVGGADAQALKLPNHGLTTGQAVVFRKQTGLVTANIGGLTDDTIYYVIRVDSDTIKLATNEQNLAQGMTVPLTSPTTAGTYRLTPIDERTVSTFNQDAVTNVTHTIALPNHGLSTGQAVIFHILNGATLTTLGNDQTYYVVRVDDNLIRLASSAPNAANDMTLDITRNGNAQYTLTTQGSFATKVFAETAVTAANEITLPNHGFTTGDVVVYRAGNDSAVGQLKPNTAYYVIRTGPNDVKLARSLQDAMQGVAIPITAPVATGLHSLTRLGTVGFANTNHIQGGQTHDTLLLTGDGRLTGSWDGGDGQNSTRVLLDTSATVEGTDQQVWVVTGTDTVGLGDRQTAFLTTTAVDFDQNAVSTDPAATDVELRKEIVLPSHRLVTGQAVLFQQLSGPLADIGGLTDNTIYYVIRIDSEKIKLAANVQDLSTGTGITLTKPTANGTYRFTPIDARTVNDFTQAQITDATNTITLHSHGLVTGQAVRFHVQSGNAPNNLPNDTTYFVVKVDQNTIKLAQSAAEAARGATIAITRGAGNSAYTLVAENSLVTSVFNGSAVAANAFTLANHGLLTGQAVVYRAGGGDVQKIRELTNNGLYYVIKVDDNTIRLAATLDAALVGMPIALTAPAPGTRQALTRVVALNRIGSLVGGREHDTVALLARSRLTGAAVGGGGFNTFVGPDASSTWTSFDALLKQFDRLIRSDDAANRQITAVSSAANSLTLAAVHGFQSGDAVVYRATEVDPGGGAKKETRPIGNLKDDMTYFVIRVSDTTIKLAATRDDAFANRPITLGAFPNTGTGHTLSRATLFTGFQSLAGGSGDDTIGLTMQSIAGFEVNALSISGGGGTNTLRANLDADTTDVSGVDELVWTMTDTQAGWVADRQAQLLLNRPIAFADTDLNTIARTITLPSHKLTTGQIVLFRTTSGNALTTLTHDTTYYVIRVDDDTIQLASTGISAAGGLTLTLPPPPQGAAPNRYTLTVIGPGETFAGADTTINTTHNTITHQGQSYPFQTGQPVVYHFSAGAGVPGLTNNTVYFVIRVNDRVLKLASSAANAAAGTAVPLTGALAGGASFTLTAKGFASTFDEKQIDTASRTIHVQHRYVTGQAVVYQRISGQSISVLSSGTPYFVIRVSDETIKLATSRDNALNGVAIAVTAPKSPNLAKGDTPNQYMLVAADPSPAFATGTIIRHRPVQVRSVGDQRQDADPAVARVRHR